MHQTDLSRASARAMRRAMRPAERTLWLSLRNRRFLGLKVRRQVPIGPCIADFYCAELRLIIEVDDDGPGGPCDAAWDPARDAWLSASGFRILHLRTSEILGNLAGALDLIAAAAQPIDPHRPI